MHAAQRPTLPAPSSPARTAHRSAGTARATPPSCRGSQRSSRHPPTCTPRSSAGQPQPAAASASLTIWRLKGGMRVRRLGCGHARHCASRTLAYPRWMPMWRPAEPRHAPPTRARLQVAQRRGFERSLLSIEHGAGQAPGQPAHLRRGSGGHKKGTRRRLGRCRHRLVTMPRTTPRCVRGGWEPAPASVCSLPVECHARCCRQEETQQLWPSDANVDLTNLLLEV